MEAQVAPEEGDALITTRSRHDLDPLLRLSPKNFCHLHSCIACTSCACSICHHIVNRSHARFQNNRCTKNNETRQQFVVTCIDYDRIRFSHVRPWRPSELKNSKRSFRITSESSRGHQIVEFAVAKRSGKHGHHLRARGEPHLEEGARLV